MKDKLSWLSLIISLPTANATARMRIWRALKALGCGVLRDGVYLLPDTPTTHTALSQQAAEVTSAGGNAQLVKLNCLNEMQQQEFRQLFTRTEDYAYLKQLVDALHLDLPRLPPNESQRALKKLERDFAAISAIDFFPDKAQEQVSALLQHTAAALAEILNTDEPQPAAGSIIRLDRSAFQQQLWATRKHLWVDRMASAWLIRRFIDPAARFKWLNTPQDCPKKALGFDFDGARFTHVGALVTFEVLLTSFIEQPDPGLTRIAALVHFLDVGGLPVAEAAGLELVLKGLKARCSNDDSLLEESSKIFDDLYLTYQGEHA